MKTKNANKKRLAICFFGHLRTFNQTCESFFKNIIEVNRNEWQIDIFMHTWDEFEKAGFAWHNHLASLDGKKVTQDDINQVLRIYKPKKFLIETLHQDRGTSISLSKVQELAREYAKEQNLNYDYTLILRPDLYFHSPLRLNNYIEFYEFHGGLKHCPLPKKHIFVAGNLFGRMPVADPRYICEGDLLWFGNFNPLPSGVCATPETDNILIPINYRLHIDYFLQRVDFRIKVNVDYVRTDYRADYALTLEKLGFCEFVRFYANKKMTKLRIATRKFRYPIKDFFKRLFN